MRYTIWICYMPCFLVAALPPSAFLRLFFWSLLSKTAFLASAFVPLFTAAALLNDDLFLQVYGWGASSCPVP